MILDFKLSRRSGVCEVLRISIALLFVRCALSRRFANILHLQSTAFQSTAEPEIYDRVTEARFQIIIEEQCTDVTNGY